MGKITTWNWKLVNFQLELTIVIHLNNSGSSSCFSTNDADRVADLFHASCNLYATSLVRGIYLAPYKDDFLQILMISFSHILPVSFLVKWHWHSKVLNLVLSWSNYDGSVLESLICCTIWDVYSFNFKKLILQLNFPKNIVIYLNARYYICLHETHIKNPTKHIVI